MDIDERLQDYAESVSSPHEPWLAELSEETHRTLGMGQMLTGPVAGRFLEMLVWGARPRRVLLHLWLMMMGTIRRRTRLRNERTTSRVRWRNLRRSIRMRTPSNGS